MERTRIAVAPATDPKLFTALCEAVEVAGGTLSDPAEASALIWADAKDATEFPATVETMPYLGWVQLPYAGIERFVHLLDDRYLCTCGKGVYADVVAEHAIGMMLAGIRQIGLHSAASQWQRLVHGELSNLLGARVLIIGGGGITESLVVLLKPWKVHTSVLRLSPEPVPGADATHQMSALAAELPEADIVVLALALTEETEGLVDSVFLDQMQPHSWLINVARGRHVVTDDLVAALTQGSIAGAALDVTHPEPLPSGHALWGLPNCIVTPHVASSDEMGRPLIAARVRENVKRWISSDELLGRVDLKLGY